MQVKQFDRKCLVASNWTQKLVDCELALCDALLHLRTNFTINITVNTFERMGQTYLEVCSWTEINTLLLWVRALCQTSLEPLVFSMTQQYCFALTN